MAGTEGYSEGVKDFNALPPENTAPTLALDKFLVIKFLVGWSFINGNLIQVDGLTPLSLGRMMEPQVLSMRLEGYPFKSNLLLKNLKRDNLNCSDAMLTILLS